MSRRFDYADVLTQQLRALQLPEPAREYRPFADRRWRLDCAWVPWLIGCEIDGGEWTGGRHARGLGMQSDCDKFNRLQLEGWVVFRFTGSMVKDGRAVTFLEPVLRLQETPRDRTSRLIDAVRGRREMPLVSTRGKSISSISEV